MRLPRRGSVPQSSKATEACRIGELAARSGLTADTLRYYERVGLLPKPARTSGGFRVYPPQALERLLFVKRAQTLGLTLTQIRDLVAFQDQGGLKRCRRVHDLLRTKLGEVQTRLTELEEFRGTLSRYLEECEQTLAGDSAPNRTEPECPVIETLTGKRR